MDTLELVLDRKYKLENYTVGKLYIEGAIFSDTMEDKDRGLMQYMPTSTLRSMKIYGKTAIPRGRYIIDMDTVSEKFRNRTWAKPYMGKIPRLVNVPVYEGVLIHPLNTAEDSLGCIGVGKNTVKGKITRSTEFFNKLMKEYLLPAHESGKIIYLTIE